MSPSRLSLILLIALALVPASAGLAKAQQGDSNGVIESAMGVTRKGVPMRCLLTSHDLDIDSKRTRVLLVGTSVATEKVVSDAISWFAGQDVETKFALSAIPQVNPDRRKPNDSQHPLRGKTPSDNAYRHATNPEAEYLWRWIGMHAPDLVVIVHDGGQSAPVVHCRPQSKLEKLKQGDNRAFTAPSLEDDGVSRRLAELSACETGSIDVLDLQIAERSGERLSRELLSQLKRIGFIGPSAARRELQKRSKRTPLQISNQLAEHYGHELKQVVYIPALALVGRLRLAELTNDESHRADVLRIAAPYLRGERDATPRSGSGLSGHLVFRELADRDAGRREQWIALAKKAADMGLDEQGRPKKIMPFHNEMSDALFMGGPILTGVGRLTKDRRYVEACVQHLRSMRRLVLRPDGLYRHSPLDETAWGRGNGFPAIGLALCLSDLPAGHQHRAELLEFYRSHMKALKKRQDPNGCWHQVIDRPESYRELSSTCMITFAMLRGLREGWLPQSDYAPVVNRSWSAIRLRVAANGRLVDVCTGTGKQKSLRDYYDRKAILGKDARGGAMALLAATEMEFWRRERNETPE